MTLSSAFESSFDTEKSVCDPVADTTDPQTSIAVDYRNHLERRRTKLQTADTINTCRQLLIVSTSPRRDISDTEHSDEVVQDDHRSGCGVCAKGTRGFQKIQD